MYLYPENLTARPMLWLWTLRDVAFIGVGLLLSVLALTQAGKVVPLVVTAALAFICIRHGGVSILDFLRAAGVGCPHEGDSTAECAEGLGRDGAAGVRR